MERQWVTAEESRSFLLDEIHHMEGDCRECGAPNPVEHEPDASGCNWTVYWIPACPPECIMTVEKAVERARQHFNLRS